MKLYPAIAILLTANLANPVAAYGYGNNIPTELTWLHGRKDSFQDCEDDAPGQVVRGLCGSGGGMDCKYGTYSSPSFTSTGCGAFPGAVIISTPTPPGAEDWQCVTTYRGTGQSLGINGRAAKAAVRTAASRLPSHIFLTRCQVPLLQTRCKGVVVENVSTPGASV